MEDGNKQRYLQTRRVTLIGALVNVFLALIKVVFGAIGHSSSLVADGLHSFSDLLTDFLVILAAKFSHQDADSDHPYGHGRIETVTSVGLAILLAIVGILIIYDAVEMLLVHRDTVVPATFVLVIALLSVVLNEGVYHYTKRAAKRLNSDLLMANALHSRSDAASSLVVLVGVAGAIAGFAWLDKVAAIIVGLMIVKMGLKIAWQNLNELIDAGVDEATLVQIKQQILSTSGVEAIHLLRTRKMAGNIMVDVHVIVSPKVSVSEGHFIGDQVMSALYKNIEHMHDVTVHVDSEDDEQFCYSAALLARKQLEPILKNAIKDLPGARQIKQMTLHYLSGALEVELELPVQLLETYSTQMLHSQYASVVGSLDDVDTLNIKFS